MRLKDWVIRFVLGIVLGFGAGAVVEAMHLAFVVFAFGGLDEYLNRKQPREEMWIHLLGLSSMLGGVSASVMASLVAVMAAPTHYNNWQILRSWVMAASLGALVGGGMGALLSLLHPQQLAFGSTMILILSGCVPAGVALALLLRLCVK